MISLRNSPASDNPDEFIDTLCRQASAVAFYSMLQEAQLKGSVRTSALPLQEPKAWSKAPHLRAPVGELGR